MKKSFYTFIVVIIIGIAVSITYSYAALMEDPGKNGEGTGQISGVIVNNIEYHVLSTDPSRIETVEFEVEKFNGDIHIKLNSASENFYPCTQISNEHWSCPVDGIALSNMDELQVIAKEL